MLLYKDRLNAYMKQGSIDAVVATSPVNVTYLSDYACWTDPIFREYMVVPGGSSNLFQNYAIVPAAGEAALVLVPLLAVGASDSWISDIYLSSANVPVLSDDASVSSEMLSQSQQFWNRLSENASAEDALVLALKNRGLDQATIGIEMEGFPAERKEAILKALPHAQLKDCSNLFRLVRMVKSPEEIACLRRSSEINETATQASLALLRPGVSADVLRQEYLRVMAAGGALLDHFSYSVNGHGIATYLPHLFGTQDLAFFDNGCIYQNYFSDTGLTISMQAFEDKAARRYEAIDRSIAQAEALLKPGATSSVIQAVMVQAIKDYDPEIDSFPHGHGFGLEVRDYPILAPANGLRIRDDCVNVSSDLPLEKDMVINLEANIFMPPRGAVHLEKSYLITETGSELLIPHDRSGPFIPKNR